MKDQKEIPIWRKDFPIRRADATQVTRRDFAKFLCMVSGGLALGTAVVAVNASRHEPTSVEKHFVCNREQVPLGGTYSFVLPHSTVLYILVRTREDEFFAYEQKCTHLSCAVYYNHREGKIECPCHNGWFDVKTGAVLAGPPPRPLPKLAVTIEREKVFVQQS